MTAVVNRTDAGDVDVSDVSSHLPSRWLVGGVLALLLVVAFGQWRSSASAFSARQQAGTTDGVLEVGESFVFGVNVPSPPDVDVTSAQVLIEGGVPVASAVVVCEPLPGTPVIGAVAGDLFDYCASAVPAAGFDLGDASDDAYLAATVVPLGTGTFEVQGFSVRFDTGFRSGTDVLTDNQARFEVTAGG